MKIALIGDSHTQVVWPVLKPILEGAGHQITSQQARAGWSVKKYLNTGAVGEVHENDPDAVIVGLGGNNHDLTDRYGETISQFIAALGNRRIIWVGPYASNMEIAASTGKRHEWTGDYLAELLPSKGVIFIDTRPISQTGQRNDGVHFTRENYRAMVDQMTPRILSGLSDSSLTLSLKRNWPWVLGISSVAALILLAYIRLKPPNRQ